MRRWVNTRRNALVLVLAAAVLFGVGMQPAGAVVTTPENPMWLQRLRGLKLVEGRPDTGLAMGQPISRAEFVTLIVRAFGQEPSARELARARSFADAEGHWASGYIAVAKRLAEQRGAAIGLPDGTFRPEGELTGPEAVAFLMKFVSVPPAQNLPWPENYLKVAEKAGLIRTDDVAVLREMGSKPIVRAGAFALADQAFYSYKLPEGATVYTTYVKTAKPTLTIESFTVNAGEKQATVTGFVSADVILVHAGPQELIGPFVKGRFTATVPWESDPTNSFGLVIVAEDLAGNRVEQSIKETL